MMAEQVIDIRPGERFAYRAMVRLGGVSVRLRFRWMPQASRWAMRMETSDGQVLTPQGLCQAGARVLYDSRIVGAPLGSLRWEGRDTLDREDLGTRLLLVWTEP